MLSIITVQVAL